MEIRFCLIVFMSLSFTVLFLSQLIRRDRSCVGYGTRGLSQLLLLQQSCNFTRIFIKLLQTKSNVKNGTEE